MELPTDWFVAWPAARAKERLDEQVRDRVPALSRERVKSAFAEGRVTVGGRPAAPGDKPAAGARIEVSVTADDAGAWQASSRAVPGFFLLYRDDDIVIVDKDAGVLTVPTDEASRGEVSGERTLVERVAESMGVRARALLPVHRLDRFTSGVLVIARTRDAKARLIDQFARHAITRRYLAITRGVPEPPAGTFRSRLASDARRLQHVSHEGELAVTHYEVAEKFGEVALVVVQLDTGKRNQIRVQFAEAGWPLVGEHRYVDVPDKSLGRQALHAAELELTHPRFGGPISAASPLPADLRAVLRRGGR